MMMKFALVAALMCAPFTAGAADLPTYPFIHANGMGAARVLPDIGEIDFEISAADQDPVAARAVVEGKVAEVRALAAELGLPEGDLEIRDVRKDMRKPDPAQPTVPTYDIRCGVHIKVRDLSKWKALVGALLDKPNLHGFATAFDVSERERIETELMGEAIKAARRKAEAMAAGLGRKLGAANAVTAGELKNLSRAMGLMPADPRYSRSPSRADYARPDFLAIDILELAQPVDVIFRIK